MKAKGRQSGFSLMEMVVVVGAAALLGVLSLPAIRAFNNSLGSVGSVKAMISASLASARAIAAKEHCYAGIRFQRRYQPDGKGPQYMIFIVHDNEATGKAYGFRAIEGIEPMKLPENIIVRDSDGNSKLSIVFSPSGKLVIQQVQALRASGADDVFNADPNIGMFPEESGRSLSQKGLVLLEINRKSGQIIQSESVYINPYTGRLIRNW